MPPNLSMLFSIAFAFVYLGSRANPARLEKGCVKRWQKLEGVNETLLWIAIVLALLAYGASDPNVLSYASVH